MLNTVQSAFAKAQEHLNEFVSNPQNLAQVLQFAETLAHSLKAGNKVISCGNGGSLCDSMHFAEELTGRFRNDRISLPAISIADPSHITCTANDYGYEHIFSRYVEGVGKKGDILVALTTSGNSPNILKALEAAKTKGMITIALLGKGGGKALAMADLPIVVPGETSDRIQEIHIKIIHIAIEATEKLMEL